MAHAQKCPLCGGTGWLSGYYGHESASDMGKQTCHGCDGKGWVVVIDSAEHGGDTKKAEVR